jgi:hypothetical protein
LFRWHVRCQVDVRIHGWIIELGADSEQWQKSGLRSTIHIDNLTTPLMLLGFGADNLVSYPERQRAGPDEAAATGDVNFARSSIQNGANSHPRISVRVASRFIRER